MLPPRRAALPLGTSSLGACGALLPREPRPVEGSRSFPAASTVRAPPLSAVSGGEAPQRERREGMVDGSVQWGSVETGRAAGRTSSCGCAAVRADRRVGGGLRGRAAAGADRRRGRDLDHALLPPESAAVRGLPSVEPLAQTVHVEGRRTWAAGRGTASRSARPPSPALIDGLAVSDLAQTAVDLDRPGVPPRPLARARASRRDAPGGPAPRAGPQRRPLGWREAYDAGPLLIRPARSGVRRVEGRPGRPESPLFATASTVRIASVGERQLGWYGATTTSTRWNSLRSE